MLRISAAVQNYDWGSTAAIPEFLGDPSTGEPVAELWFGTHRLGMSTVIGPEGPQPLTDAGGNLAFMLKVLAPAQPLSIQVHPASELAESGFAAEDAAGVELDDPARDYKDPFPKPEMVYALTPFETLVGLRPAAQVLRLLTPLDVPLAKSLLALADDGPGAMVELLLSSPPDRDSVNAFVAACAAQLDAGNDVGRGYLTVMEAARVHPGDPGLAIALLMNRLTIAAGEAAFIGPGLIHAHLSGLCLEVMVASDNVFRAGLTTKRVNPQGVLDSLDTVEGDDPGVAPRSLGTSTKVYEPGGGLFALAVTSGDEDQLPGSGHRIALCLDGDVRLVAESGASVALRRGEAAFATPDDGALAVRGSGTIAQAYVP
ncbi:MAG TPA: mannose-6-phosphate isomerase, class I [Aeromicrobium sp.]|nr:mannose-6-phosphate isomerase, class I [Aeromicrobium sp.]